MSPEGNVESLKARIGELESQLEDSSCGIALREALSRVKSAESLFSPDLNTEILTKIVQTAKDLLGTEAAALLLVDGQQLVFSVVCGGAGVELMNVAVPIHQGFAGMVASTGQPIAVEDVENHPSWAKDIGESVSYKPKTILCVPLLDEGRVIGVLELLDKVDGGNFDTSDLNAAGHFANLAAAGIHAARASENLTAIVWGALSGIAEEEDPLREKMKLATRRLEKNPRQSEMLEISALVSEICQRHHSRGTRLVREILAAIESSFRSPFGL
jgi:GAF domain-containing protein